MSRFKIGLLIMLSLVSLFSLLIFSNVNAAPDTTTTTVVERHVITTPVPTAKEIMNIPTGYVNCFTVSAGWFHDEWIPEHKVCQYENMTEGVAWVDGYWACNKNTADGVCTNWEWRAGHWQKSLEVY